MRAVSIAIPVLSIFVPIQSSGAFQAPFSSVPGCKVCARIRPSTANVQLRKRADTATMTKSTSLFSTVVADGNNDDNLHQKTKTIRKGLNREFLSIAFPALIQLAAEPLAGLVDTAYLGRLGPDVLGGAGVAISAQVREDFPS